MNMLNGKFCGGASPRCVAAALANMDDLDGACESPHVSSEAEIQNAISKIDDGHFAVVGLAEKYADSVRKLRKYLTGAGATAAVGAPKKGPRAAAHAAGRDEKVAKVGALQDLDPLVPFGEGPEVMRGGAGQGGGDYEAEGAAGHRGRAPARRGVRLVPDPRVVMKDLF